VVFAEISIPYAIISFNDHIVYNDWMENTCNEYWMGLWYKFELSLGVIHIWLAIHDNVNRLKCRINLNIFQYESRSKLWNEHNF